MLLPPPSGKKEIWSFQIASAISQSSEFWHFPVISSSDSSNDLRGPFVHPFPFKSSPFLTLFYFLVRPATSPIKKGGMNQTLLGEHVHRCLHQPDWILLLCRWLSALLLPSLSDHPDWDQRWKSDALQGVQASGCRVLRRLARWRQPQIFSFFFCLGTTQHEVYSLMTYIESAIFLFLFCICFVPRKRIDTPYSPYTLLCSSHHLLCHSCIQKSCIHLLGKASTYSQRYHCNSSWLMDLQIVERERGARRATLDTSGRLPTSTGMLQNWFTLAGSSLYHLTGMWLDKHGKQQKLQYQFYH